jgi:D-xylose transport system ATP-binding protein
MALVGDNGAGKSTLVKSVVGIYPFDEGEVLYDGAHVNVHGPRDAAKLGIEVVYQDLALADNLDVVQNMYLGREEHDLFFRLKESPMEHKTAETLASLSVTTIGSVRRPVATLSGGQRQSVAVARAVMWNNRVVFLDEPTAALGVAQTESVLQLVRSVAGHGTGILIITHDVASVMKVCDRVVVLRHGGLVFEGETAELSELQLLQLMAGLELDAAAGSRDPGLVR